MGLGRKTLEYAMICFFALSLSGCWKETPVCEQLKQEVRNIQLGHEASRLYEIAKAYFSGDQTQITALQLDPELGRELGRLRQRIVDNHCIDWEAGGIRG